MLLLAQDQIYGEIIRIEVKAIFFLYCCASLYAEQYIVSLCIFFLHVMTIIRGNNADLELSCECDELFVYIHLFSETIILDFDVKIFRTKYISIFKSLLPCPINHSPLQIIGHLSFKTC